MCSGSPTIRERGAYTGYIGALDWTSGKLCTVAADETRPSCTTQPTPHACTGNLWFIHRWLLLTLSPLCRLGVLPCMSISQLVSQPCLFFAHFCAFSFARLLILPQVQVTFSNRGNGAPRARSSPRSAGSAEGSWKADDQPPHPLNTNGLPCYF